MTTTQATPVALSHEQIAEMLDLLKGSDSVELKLTVPEHDQRSAVVALGMDPLEAQIRQVFFFDTPDLALDKLGVVVRARRIQGKGDDSVVKLRPVVPSELPDELRAAAGFRVEVDALPGGFVCSGTLKRTLDSGEVQRVVAGERPLRKLYSKQQRAYFAEHAPGHRARRPVDARADLRAQASLHSGGARPQDRRRDVDLPRRVARARALDPRRDERGVPGRGRGARVPRKQGHRSFGRAADEDEEGARVLRGRAQERELSQTSPGVTPRWEWRAFGESFGGAETRLGELTADLEEESDDLYLLSVASNASVKVRGGLLDLKKLQRVDEDGLEQWKPVLKAGFPVAAADVQSMLAALEVEHVPERAEYTLEQLLGELPELLAVEVHKRRRHVTVGGAMAELSELGTDQGVLRTIAVESEDPALVTAAVRELGLDLQSKRVRPAGPEGAFRARPLRRGRRRHQLGQVRDRRACAATASGGRSSTGPR